MTDPFTLDELQEMGELLKAEQHRAEASESMPVMHVRGETFGRLLAAARELHELKSALGFLNEAACASIVYGEDCNEIGLGPKDIIDGARRLGWSPSNGGTDG